MSAADRQSPCMAFVEASQLGVCQSYTPQTNRECHKCGPSKEPYRYSRPFKNGIQRGSMSFKGRVCFCGKCLAGMWGVGLHWKSECPDTYCRLRSNEKTLCKVFDGSLQGLRHPPRSDPQVESWNCPMRAAASQGPIPHCRTVQSIPRPPCRLYVLMVDDRNSGV